MGIDCYKDNALLDATEIFDLSKFDDVRVTWEGKTGQFELVSNGNNRIFVASSTKEMNDWITKIKQCMLKKDTNSQKSITRPTKTIISKHRKSDMLSQQFTESDITKLSAWYSSEIQSLQTKHEKERNELLFRLKNIQNELDKTKQNKYDEIEGKVDKMYTPKSIQRGLLIFQKNEIKNKQLMQIQNHFQS